MTAGQKDTTMGNGIVGSNIIWNTIGNIFYLGCQWLLSVVVVRVSGSYADAGILTLAISISNIFATLAAFGVRNYQVSDTGEKYSQSDYIFHRVITCAAAILLCAVFTALSGYAFNAALSIVAYMLMRMVEAFADVFHGIFQKHWRFDIVGRSCIYRGAVLLVCFTAAYKYSGNLSVAMTIMAAMTAIVFYLYDFKKICKFTSISGQFDKNSLLNLSKDCLPVLGYNIFLNSIVLTARFFIERYHGAEMLGYYGSVSTIAVIVQTTANLVMLPLNEVICSYYIQKESREILVLSRKVILLLAAISGVSLVGALVLGNVALVLLFGESISPYTYLLIPTIFASCLTGLVLFLGMLLTIVRQMKMLITGAAVGFTISAVLSFLWVPQYAFDGANAAVITALTAIGIFYAVTARKAICRTDIF